VTYVEVFFASATVQTIEVRMTNALAIGIAGDTATANTTAIAEFAVGIAIETQGALVTQFSTETDVTVALASLSMAQF